MKKRLTSFILVLALSFSLSVSAFAVDDSDYYSFSPVDGSDPSPVIDWPVSPYSSHDGFLAEDSANLARIMTDLTTTGMNTVKTYIADIRDALSRGGSVYAFLSSIENALTAQNVHGSLAWYVKHIGSSLTSIDANLSTITGSFSGQGLATESTLSALSSSFMDAFAYDATIGKQYGYAWLTYDADGTQVWHRKDTGWWFEQIPALLGLLGQDAIIAAANGHDYSLFHYVKNLSQTLASEDDKQLAQNQKDNRDQAQQDFLSGSSGKTSLGKEDFSNASQVGGALNDTFNMGGAAKVSDFLSGFGSAGTESQAWFSQTTSNNLNAVDAGDGTSGVSTFADDGHSMVDVDPDPFNMADIFGRYDWLEGVNMDG